MSKIIVLGSNFAGLTSAIEVKKRLGKDSDVTVISPSKNFLYVPSLIWMPFGRRKVDDIIFPVEPLLKKRKIKFMHDSAAKIYPDKNMVLTKEHGSKSISPGSLRNLTWAISGSGE